MTELSIHPTLIHMLVHGSFQAHIQVLDWRSARIQVVVHASLQSLCWVVVVPL